MRQYVVTLSQDNKNCKIISGTFALFYLEQEHTYFIWNLGHLFGVNNITKTKIAVIFEHTTSNNSII